MYIYSELLHKKFDTIKEAKEAEAAYKAEQEAEIARNQAAAAEKEARKKEVDEAFGVAYDLLKGFIADYGEYYSYSSYPFVWPFF